MEIWTHTQFLCLFRPVYFIFVFKGSRTFLTRGQRERYCTLLSYRKGAEKLSTFSGSLRFYGKKLHESGAEKQGKTRNGVTLLHCPFEEFYFHRNTVD